jgi:hypothetical protein
MHVRPLVAVTVAAGLAIPAYALAEGIGPHASWYDENPHGTKPANDVSIVVHRDKHKADVFVNNFCLGSQTSDGTKYPNNASARGVKVRKGKIAYDGRGTIYTSDGQQERVPMRFGATITRKQATGTAKFPGTKCGTIAFKAKLAGRTK